MDAMIPFCIGLTGLGAFGLYTIYRTIYPRRNNRG